jgi:peptide/nickel transport system permease protein/peptide/nickel transport system substrate-binding protein
MRTRNTTPLVTTSFDSITTNTITPHTMPLNRRSLLALMAATAAAAASGDVSAQGAVSKMLRISTPYNPSTLDPHTGSAGSDHVILYPMFDTLIGFDPDTLQPRPSLATAWNYPDPLTLVLTIRPGITFHDGEPLNAEAVRFNLERVRSDARSVIKTELGTVASIEATGDMQVTLKLKQPDSALPLILADRAGMMVSPKAIEQHGADSDRNPVGTGRMKFVSWAANNSIKMTRFENHWQKDLPQLDGIEFNIITDVVTGVRSVISGQNNFIYQLRPAQQQALARNKEIEVGVSQGLYSVAMYFNYSRPPLNDVRVRTALNLAIDRDALNKAIMMGLGTPAHTVLPASHWACNKAVTNYYKYDPDRAKALLAEAGYKDGLDLAFSGYSDQRSVQIQEVLISMLAKCGARAKFTTGALAVVTADYFTNKKGDGTLAAWTGRPDPSVSFALMFNKESFLNAGRVEVSPELTQTILESRKYTELDKRKAALDRVQVLVAENALYLPLVFQPEIVGHAKNVVGYKPNLLGKPRFDGVTIKS